MSGLLKVALVQNACALSPRENLDKIAASVEAAAGNGARLVLLSELHNTRYFCQTMNAENFDLAEPVPGPTTDFLGMLAKSLGVVIVSSIFERRDPSLFHNTAVVLDTDGCIAGIYRKMHVPDDPGYLEKYYFSPGDLGFSPIQTSLGRIGILVCWDQWFPEAVRALALAGAQMICIPTAIGWNPGENDKEQERQLDAWVTVQRGHAIANAIPLMVCNRVGWEPSECNDSGIQFWGNSFVVGPQAEVLAQASRVESELLITEIDLNRTEEVRRAWPFFRDRRGKDYQGLLKQSVSRVDSGGAEGNDFGQKV